MNSLFYPVFSRISLKKDGQLRGVLKSFVEFSVEIKGINLFYVFIIKLS